MSVNLQNKKKITVGVAAVAAAAITLGAGTYAFFSSSLTGPSTTATAGTVVLTGGTLNANLTLTGLVPGGPTTPHTVTYTNGGTVPATLNLALAVSDTEDGCTGDEAIFDLQTPNCGTSTQGELSGKLQVAVTKQVGTAAPVTVYPATGPAGPVSGFTADSTPGVSNGQSVVYTFVYSFPEGGATDNAAQGDSTTVTTSATLSS